MDEKALEKAFNAGLRKLDSLVVMPDTYTKQEAAMIHNFQACLEEAIKVYVKEMGYE